jgi:ABC-type antimicrobial peptide transport system permease subunit
MSGPVGAGGLVVGYWGMSSFISSLLFGITATHPATYILAAVVAAAIGLPGAYIPARRATTVDPVVAIRIE